MVIIVFLPHYAYALRGNNRVLVQVSLLFDLTRSRHLWYGRWRGLEWLQVEQVRQFSSLAGVTILITCCTVSHHKGINIPSLGSLKKGWGPVNVFSTGWQQEGHPFAKSLHILPPYARNKLSYFMSGHNFGS